MTREEMLAKVDAAYHARRTGDFAALGDVVAADAVFDYAGDQTMLAAVPGTGGAAVADVARTLFEQIEMHALERVQAVAEDNRVAILWRTTLAPAGGKPFDTMMFDLWEFDAEGRICRGTQFLDTAKVVDVMRAQD
jgi:ketosteroid isomerase-like protein